MKTIFLITLFIVCGISEAKENYKYIEESEEIPIFSNSTPVLQPLNGNTKPIIVREKPKTNRSTAGLVYADDAEEAVTYHPNKTPKMNDPNLVLYKKKSFSERKKTSGRKYPIY